MTPIVSVQISASASVRSAGGDGRRSERTVRGALVVRSALDFLPRVPMILSLPIAKIHAVYEKMPWRPVYAPGALNIFLPPAVAKCHSVATVQRRWRGAPALGRSSKPGP